MSIFRTVQLIFSVLALVLLASCEKEVSVIPADLPPRLVVDGRIENGEPPVVFLTRSLGFFNRITADMVAASFVRGAVVRVSDGARTVTLREYELALDTGRVWFYAPDTTNPAQLMIGAFGRRYALTIEHEGQRYESSTFIPPIGRRMDSLWWTPAPANRDTNRVVVMARITDPPGLGNYIRYFTARNDSAFVPGLNSVIDDAIVDGTTYDVQVFRGQNRNQPFDSEEFGFFRRGDRVRVKLSNIDKATFDFWRTWEQSQSNVGNPFAVPVRILGNISNGALGLWGGYGSQVLSLDIPR